MIYEFYQSMRGNVHMQYTACVAITNDFSKRSPDLQPWLEGSQHTKYDFTTQYEHLIVYHMQICVYYYMCVMSLVATVMGGNIFV